MDITIFIEQNYPFVICTQRPIFPYLGNRQKVKTKMRCRKCGISSGPALFALVKPKLNQDNFEILNSKHL